MPDQLLIADSSPLIALSGVSLLHILPRLYPRVGAPPAVIEEITAGSKLTPHHDFLSQVPWLERLPLPSLRDVLSTVIGRGETEAISLALSHTDAILLLDDHQARRAAEANNLPVIGSAGILVRAKRNHLIDMVHPILIAMRSNGYYLSDRVIRKACEMAGE